MLVMFLSGVAIAFMSSLAIDEALENQRLKKQIDKLENDLDYRKLVDDMKGIDNNEQN